MTESYIMVEHTDGTIYYTNDYGARIVDFNVPSTTWSHQTVKVEGRDGEIPISSTYDRKPIRLAFTFFAESIQDFNEKKSIFNKIFASHQTIFVSDSSNPGIRWGVRAEPFSIEREGLRGRAEIELIAFDGHSETVNVESHTFMPYYATFHNPGDVTIDMTKQDETEIEFTGESTNLIIRNVTTGDEWSWNGVMGVDDTLLLKGVRATINGSSVFGLSNRKVLRLAPGDNEFEVLGAADDPTLTIRTRFYYL